MCEGNEVFFVIAILCGSFAMVGICIYLAINYKPRNLFRPLSAGPVAEQIFEFPFLQFQQGLVKDPVVGFETYFGNKTALLCSEQVACTPYIQILHGNVQSTSNL